MPNINLAELTSQSAELHSALKEKDKKIKEYLKDNALSEFPKGIDFSCDLSKSYHEPGDISCQIRIFDNNNLEDQKYSKYFWDDIGTIEFKFSQHKDTKYYAKFGSGGYNSHEYGNKDRPEIDHLDTQEILLDIRKSSIQLMKNMKQNSVDFVSLCEDYIKHKEKYIDLKCAINNEHGRLKSLKRDEDIDKANNLVTTATKEDIDRILQRLNETGTDYKKLAMVKRRFSGDDVILEVINLERRKGEKRTTYRILHVNSHEERAIKKSELSNILSEVVVINGEELNIEKIVNFLNTPEINENYENGGFKRNKSLSIPLEVIANAL